MDIEFIDADDDAPAEEAPRSEARRRLASLIDARNEASAEMDRARQAIQRLQSAQSLPGPIEAELVQLDADEGAAMAQWSGSGGAFPALDAERREALIKALAEARNAAVAAARAIPALESEFTRASIKANAISHAISATIAEILLEEIEPEYAAIVEAKRDLSAAIARAENGREAALSLCEASIPAERRPAVASGFYQGLGTVDKVRALAMSNPAPSYDRGPWARLIADLASGNANSTAGS